MGWDDAEHVPSFQSLGTTFREQTREQRWLVPVLEEGVRHAVLQGGLFWGQGCSGSRVACSGLDQEHSSQARSCPYPLDCISVVGSASCPRDGGHVVGPQAAAEPHPARVQLPP